MNDKKKEPIWLALFTVLPVSLLWPLGEYFEEQGINQTLVSALLGGLGGLIGFGLYSWTKSKSTKTKIIGIVSILVLGIAIIRIVHTSSVEVLKTCEICGYKAIDKQENECNVCASNTWETEQADKLYDSKLEWLKDEQLFWFAEDDTSFVEFYEPNQIDGFFKDENWRPIINKIDVFEYNKE
ncbi:hypothetical protein LVD15_00160 [Fulvivirga maritima]|uniref:hypothetical protein n=1 Tax=Fulvivirga maritima TaxID=2904247 RepID=UPI001F24B0AB|nr:hypothetical protein [Fulvivirga maritima]UII26885.1 hypothetical protein LVD15_00160 [Fulvivirga maritima]